VNYPSLPFIERGGFFGGGDNLENRGLVTSGYANIYQAIPAVPAVQIVLF